MTVSIFVNQLFENPFEVAQKLHNAYVAGGASSMQEENHPHFFRISSIEAHEDQTFTVHLLKKSIKRKGIDAEDSEIKFIEYSTDPLSKEKLIKTLCGGKFKGNCSTGGEPVYFNTKEAFFGIRLKMVLDLLNEFKIEHSEQEIKETITNITLNDNSKGILATHWIHSLENTHGFTAVELMHMLWCIYINWDDTAAVLSSPLPLMDDSLISKDKDILSSAEEILGVSAKETTSPHHSDIAVDITNVLCELQRQFIESSLSLIFNEDIELLTEYFVSRYNKLTYSETQINTDNLNLFKHRFQKRIDDALLIQNASTSLKG